MANSPMYYGERGSSSPMYYGGKKPMYYGGAARNYGAVPYGGGGAYGGAYGTYGYGAYGGMAYGGNKEGESESFVGTITIGRMLRVISQRWLSIFVFLLVGLIVSFAIYRISPTI